MNLLNPLKRKFARRRSPNSPEIWLAAVMLTVVGHPLERSFAQDSAIEEQGTHVLTRGPVHEAFAGVISFDPLPGIVVTAIPPGLIEEIPPDERPEGDDVAWIPGYWAWDDERNDFLWVSGIWRALPPGREWIVGYWGEAAEGYQWTSGYWADVTITETTYLPAPPPTLEEGPNIEAPSIDYGWTPGSWVWTHERYAWSPGYWAEGHSDWDWIPAHYVWTPRGHVFVGGYWDYAVERRGVLFAPVYLDRAVYSRAGYSYSPSIVINLTILTSHLFLRPRYDHYYFGDYYARRYNEGGFYASFSYQSSRRGYDPLYARQRWKHRDNRDWERGIESDYRLRRDDESARPPHTWAAQREMEARQPDDSGNRSMLATSFDQLSRREDSSLRFQSVGRDDREVLVRRGQEVQQSREQRRTLEVRDVETRRDSGDNVVSKVPASRSPIAAKAESKGEGTGRPPEPPRTAGREQPGRPAMEDKGKGRTPEVPQAPGNRPQPEQPGRPAMEDKGKGRAPEVPQAPGTRPQPEQSGRPAMEDKGKGRAPDVPQAPGTRPQPEQSGRPAMEDKGKSRAPDVPQAPGITPQPEQPGRPAMEEKGKGRAPEVPQAPATKPRQSPAPPQGERPARENRGKSERTEPVPRANPEPAPAAPAPPKVERPNVTEGKGKEKGDDDNPGGRRKN